MHKRQRARAVIKREESLWALAALLTPPSCVRSLDHTVVLTLTDPGCCHGFDGGNPMTSFSEPSQSGEQVTSHPPQAPCSHGDLSPTPPTPSHPTLPHSSPTPSSLFPSLYVKSIFFVFSPNELDFSLCLKKLLPCAHFSTKILMLVYCISKALLIKKGSVLQPISAQNTSI